MISGSKTFQPEVCIMKQLLALCFKRQEADNYKEFNTMESSGSEKRKVRKLPWSLNCRSRGGQHWEVGSEGNWTLWAWILVSAQWLLQCGASIILTSQWKRRFHFLQKLLYTHVHKLAQFQGIHGPLWRLSVKPPREWFPNMSEHQLN